MEVNRWIHPNDISPQGGKRREEKGKGWNKGKTGNFKNLFKSYDIP